MNRTFLLLSAMTLLAAPVSALPIYDGFRYAPGAVLPGRTNDDGLDWAPAGPVGPNILIDAGNLPVPGLIPPGGDRIRFAGVAAPSARLGLGTNVAGGTVDLSFALKVTDLTGLSGTGGYMAGFNNATGASMATPTPVGARVLTRSTPGGYNVGVCKASDLAVDFRWDPRVFTTNDTVFLIASYTFNPGTSTDDLARLWVAPNPMDFGASNAPAISLTSSDGPDLDKLSSFVFFQRNGGVQPAVSLADELRIGLSWASVAPPPPPPQDFGDALAPPYPTLLPAAARHRLTGLFMGALIDAEANGQPVDQDNVIGTADEDGVVFGPLVPNTASYLDVTVTGAGRVDAWIDWNRVAAWEAPEQILVSAAVPGPGTYRLPFAVPNFIPLGPTWARVRFSGAGGLTPTGYAPDGEVEDYLVEINGAPLVFAGLLHTSSGAAGLSVISNALLISNLQSSNDSVRVELGQAEGWAAKFGSNSTSLLTEQISLNLTLRGHVPSLSEIVVTKVRCAGQGSNLLFSVDASALGATSNRVELYDGNGTLLHHATVPNGDGIPLTFATAAGSNCSGGSVVTFRWTRVEGDNGSGFEFRCNTAEFENPNGTSVTNISRLKFIPQNVTSAPDYLSSVVLSGHDLSQLTIQSEALQKFGLWHSGLGDARLDATAAGLGVGNIGSSGEDGVSVEPGSRQIPADEVHGYIYWPTLLLPVQPARAVGMTMDVETRHLGLASPASVSLRGIGAGSAEVTVDFSTLGATTARVEVFNAGQFVGAATFPQSIHPTLSGNGAFRHFGVTVAGRPAIIYGEGDDTLTVNVPGQPALAGDTFRFLPDNPTVPVPSLAGVSLRAANLDVPLTLMNETLVAIQPPRLDSALKFVNGHPQFSFSTQPGVRYVVEYKNSLSDASWSNLTVVIGNGAELTINDATTAVPSRFYRARSGETSLGD